MLLRLGSEGEDVKKLQQFLGVDVVGKFGPKTDAAVKAWQSAHGLTADGVVGPGTWAKMFPSSTPTPAPVQQPVAQSTSPSLFRLDKLKGHVPQAVIDAIPDTAAKFNITTPLRLAHFLAQCGHESGGFRATQENLNYSAKGLRGIFKKYFPTDAIAAAYQRNPQKIANKVYASRMGNGPESSGEGYKFRGRGFLQITGKDNYAAASKALGVDFIQNPDLISSKYALLTAGWFFQRNKLWSICDQGSSSQVVSAVTKRVNGGQIGISDRIRHFNEYYNLLK